MGFSLEKALVDPEGQIMTCPWHGMKYQALTGECLSAVDTRLTAHPARVEDGRVWVRLSP
jgi:nitrite reductase/ring-hydroxylating ferredoxin subunit